MAKRNWIPATEAAVKRRETGQILVQPDQRRTAPAKRGSVSRPTRRAVAGEESLAHATRLTAWIHAVNPRQSELCNNAEWPIDNRAMSKAVRSEKSVVTSSSDKIACRHSQPK